MDEATWKAMYDVVPPFLTQEQRQAWIKKLSNVAVASDAFFPFRDNVDRARQVTTMMYYTWITLPVGLVIEDQQAIFTIQSIKNHLNGLVRKISNFMCTFMFMRWK